MKRLVTALIVASTGGVASADTVETLIDNGPPGNRLNMVILGDGYTSSPTDQAKLVTDANNVVTGLFGFRPYQDYRGLFNVKLVHTVSSSSVIPKAGAGSTQTALGCYYGCAGIDRLICCGSGSEGSVSAVLATNVPEVTVGVVVINDATYGGSGGQYAVVSTNPAAIDIGRHELGHTLGSLADEYDAPYPGFPPCDAATDCAEPNVTLHAVKPGKWGPWVDAAQVVPTPPGTPGVGYFVGARYQTSGVYRPVDNPVCIMKALGVQFCPVCSEAMSLAFWNHALPVDATVPAAGVMVTTDGCTTQDFEVKVPANAGQLSFTWKVDGTVVAPTTAKVSLGTGAFGVGAHTVEVAVHDATALIRTDPHMLTSKSESWPWQTSCVGGEDAGAADGPGSGSGGGGHGGGCNTTPGNDGFATLLLCGAAIAIRRRRRGCA